jgi:hypothetical protein
MTFGKLEQVVSLTAASGQAFHQHHALPNRPLDWSAVPTGLRGECGYGLNAMVERKVAVWRAKK